MMLGCSGARHPDPERTFVSLCESLGWRHCGLSCPVPAAVPTAPLLLQPPARGPAGTAKESAPAAKGRERAGGSEEGEVTSARVQEGPNSRAATASPRWLWVNLRPTHSPGAFRLPIPLKASVQAQKRPHDAEAEQNTARLPMDCAVGRVLPVQNKTREVSPEHSPASREAGGEASPGCPYLLAETPVKRQRSDRRH